MGNWLVNLFTHTSVAQSIILVAATIFGGLALAKLKFKGLSLGVTWILFVGILIGQFEFIPLDDEVLHFVKEFGLILFVYSIGLQVGPGFFSSFKSGGVTLNMLAVGIVALGGITAALIGIFCDDMDLASMAGIMSGAVTNTPGLGAAQQTYYDLYHESASILSAGYAIAYPMGVIGVVLTCLAISKLCKDKEKVEQVMDQKNMDMFTIEIRNNACDNITIGKLKDILGVKFVVTRLYHPEKQFMEVPNDASVLSLGDRIYVVCDKASSQNVEMCTGNRIEMNLDEWDLLDNRLISKKLKVTRAEVEGKTIAEMNFRGNYNLNISRVIRGDVSIFPSTGLRVALGDIIVVVGNEQGIQQAATYVGNAKAKLNEPFLMPIFLGIMLGVILGCVPLTIPGVPIPVKLGLAGGPLVVAILMSRFGTRMGIVTYATHSAKKMLQEVGITLFMAAVGLSSGKIFFTTLMEQGLSWFLMGAMITIIPVVIISLIGRFFCKLEVPQLLGLLSGGMTDPAALAFSNTITEGKASLSYATVYPLTMFCRILCAQVIILLSVG